MALNFVARWFSLVESRSQSALPPLTGGSGRKRQLLVDVSVIYRRDARTGIQRVVRGLLLQLQATAPPDIIIVPVFATGAHGYAPAQRGFLDERDAPPPQALALVEVGAGDIFFGLDLAAHLLPLHERQIADWKRKGVTIHLMVYDLLPVNGPKWFQRSTKLHFRRWLGFLARQADGAICISSATRDALRDWLARHHPAAMRRIKLSTTRLGGDIHSTAPSTDDDVPLDPGLAELFSKRPVLMVGTIEPRKGYDKALAAFDHLWSSVHGSETTLVIVGKPGWKTGLLQRRMRHHPQQGRKMFWLENASDELLDRLYRSCSGVLVTSHGEGYGLPVIEAAWFEKPALVRDLPVFREIGYPDTSYYIDDTAQALARAILAWRSVPSVAPASNDKFVSSWSVAAQDVLVALGLSQAQQVATPVHDPQPAHA